MTRPGAGAGPWQRIEDLAADSGATVRNIRVYQEKGLLPPPVRQGRSALYGPEHRRRLRLILRLLDRGYTFATINELFTAERHGLTLTELIEARGTTFARPSGRGRKRFSRSAAEELAGFGMPEELLEMGNEVGLASEPGAADDFFADVHMYALFHELIRIGLDEAGIERIGSLIINGQRTAAEAIDSVVEALRASGATQPQIEDRVESLLPRAGGAARLIFLSAVGTLLTERHGFPRR